ncbi:cytochrome P450 [Nocardia sp. NPDC101769]|uniref:cytochrome P450 n=1 Tax=Nocardia sp. NPDC101769 TaxID=3364333 RepID=UPI00381F5FCB
MTLGKPRAVTGGEHELGYREKMRGHATTIAREVNRMLAGWGDAGEVDLLEFLAELTMYTSSACLIGPRFREELDGRFARLFHDRRHDDARHQLMKLVRHIMAGRMANPSTGENERDLLDELVSDPDEQGRPCFSPSEVTGIFISIMVAGHHTASGAAAWTIIELLRNPQVLAQVVIELDSLYADGADASSAALQQMPNLEAVLEEVLRRHPPLIIDPGDLMATSPAVSIRIPDVGEAFTLIQLKAIFSILLRDWEFELAQPSDSYGDDHSGMAAEPRQPCAVRYRRRTRPPES